MGVSPRASHHLLVQALGLLALASQLLRGASATTFLVGDDKGWVVGSVNYTQWASNKTFHVGDTLEFIYLKEYHSVLEVDQAGYLNCSVSDPIAKYDDEKTMVELKKAGAYYFICGSSRHCPNGMKLQVTALELSAQVPSPAPALSGAPPPSSGGRKPSPRKPKAPASSPPSSALPAHQVSRCGVFVSMFCLILLSI